MNYRDKTKEIVDKLNPKTQQLAVSAIKRLRKQEDKRNYRGIYTALKIKSIEDWNKWGFGLMWKNSFIKQVEYQLEKEDNLNRIEIEAATINVAAFWAEEEELDEEDTLIIS